MPVNPIEEQSFGRAGAIFESGTTAVSGSFCAVQVMSEATFSALDWPELSGDALTGVAIPTGTVIYGDIQGFTLTSGSVLAYKAAR